MKKVKAVLNKLEPNQVFENLLIWFDSKKRMAFLITLLVGIITHISIITDMIMSQDGLWNSIDYFRPGEWETTLGRWGIALVERFNFFIAIPTVSTISCILCMAMASVFLIDIFEFKSKISIIFTSLILVLTPTLTATLLYVYTAFAYCANFLISILVIWFLYKFNYKKIGVLISSLCFMLSLSIYQSYIGVTTGLAIMITAIKLVKNEKTIKEILKELCITAFVVFVGAILYYLTTLCILKINDLELTNYRDYGSGINISSIINNFGSSIIYAYKDFFDFFLKDNIVYNSNYRREIFYGILLIIFAIAYVFKIASIQEKNGKSKIIRGILSGLLFLSIPIGLNIIDLLIIKNEMYALSATQMIIIIPFIFAIFETMDKSIIMKWITIICCLYIMGTYYIADNTSYAALKLTYNQAYSTTVRVLDRIENTEGYNSEYPILFGGIIGNYNYPRTSILYGYTIGSIVNNPVFHDTYSGLVGIWTKFIKIFFGLDVQVCSPDVYYTIVTGEEYKQMDRFPGKNSVKIINGVVVVKFHDDIKLPY